MARLRTSGFELNSLTNGMEFAAINSTPTISTTTVRSGTYSGRISSLSSGVAQAFRLQYVAAGGGNGPYWHRTYLRIATLPSAQNRIISIRDTNAGADRMWITLDEGGALRLFNGAGTQIGSASSALSTGTWYRIGTKIDRTAAAGSQVIEAAINGAVFATSSAETIATAVGDTLRVGGNLNTEAQTQGDWFFDDLAVNDSNAGGNQTAYPGSGKVILLSPNAAGDANAWKDTAVGNGTTNNFSLVDELPPNDATDFVQSGVVVTDAAGAEDLYNVGASGIGANDNVNLVDVNARVANITLADATTAAKLEIEKASGGTKTQSAAFIPNSTTWTTNNSLAILAPLITTYLGPDGAVWTQSTLDSMQIGQIITAQNVRRIAISGIWAQVDYTPAGVSPSASLSPSASTSPSASLSPSSSASASISPSASLSPSASASASVSPSASISPSASASASLSPSSSVSPSASISASLSPSASASPSPSQEIIGIGTEIKAVKQVDNITIVKAPAVEIKIID
jgi:hypothetical protein